MTHSFQTVTDQADIDTVAALAQEIWNEHFPQLVGQALVDYMLATFQSAEAIQNQISEGYQYHLLLADGQPAGYLALIPHSPAGKMMISKLYLLRSMRGTGLGAAMLDVAKGQCRDNGLSAVWLTVNRHNQTTIDWYLRRGFRHAGDIVKDIGNGFVMDDFVMEMELPLEVPRD